MTSRPEDDPGPDASYDAAWRSIVENYGEEPAFPTEEPVVVGRLAEDHFVPPPPPPAPVPRGLRGLAWVGVLGVPVLTVLLVVLPWSVPTWVGLLLLAWCTGGFVYLVATMGGPAGDGWDDGAVV